MADELPEGIEIEDGSDRVTIRIDGFEWHGTPAQAERVLTGLHLRDSAGSSRYQHRQHALEWQTLGRSSSSPTKTRRSG